MTGIDQNLNCLGYLDTDGDLVQDPDEPTASTGANGLIELDIVAAEGTKWVVAPSLVNTCNSQVSGAPLSIGLMSLLSETATAAPLIVSAYSGIAAALVLNHAMSQADANRLVCQVVVQRDHSATSDCTSAAEIGAAPVVARCLDGGSAVDVCHRVDLNAEVDLRYAAFLDDYLALGAPLVLLRPIVSRMLFASMISRLDLAIQSPCAFTFPCGVAATGRVELHQVYYAALAETALTGGPHTTFLRNSTAMKVFFARAEELVGVTVAEGAKNDFLTGLETEVAIAFASLGLPAPPVTSVVPGIVADIRSPSLAGRPRLVALCRLFAPDPSVCGDSE